MAAEQELKLPSHWKYDFEHGAKFDYLIGSKEDIETFRSFAESTDGWVVAYDKSDIKVWSRSVEGSSINIVRAWAKVKDVTPATFYDVLHDPDYRKEWDENMLEGFCLEQVDPHNDVGYYSAKSPFFMIAGRDFCNQRSWYVPEDKKEYIIFNHSVPHHKCPEKKGIVRAISFLSGYLVRPDPDDEKSCTLIYVTQSDPKGWIPAWAMNQATKSFAPKLIEKLSTVSLKYNEWKDKHNPEKKPWLSSAKYPWEDGYKKAEKKDDTEKKSEEKEKKSEDKKKEKKK